MHVDYQLTHHHEAIRDGSGNEVRLTIAALADFDSAVDQLFHVLQARGEAERLHELCPFFGNLWPAARGLARYLGKRGRGALQDKRVLEVGCGLALPGLVAARLGADVTVTDGHPEVPYFLQRNMTLNDLTGVRYVEADWRLEGILLGSFDLVIGSDVLYERTHPEYLARLIKSHLAPGGEVIVADPGRAYLQDFERRMQASGFVTSVESEGEIFVLSMHASN